MEFLYILLIVVLAALVVLFASFMADAAIRAEREGVTLWAAMKTQSRRKRQEVDLPWEFDHFRSLGTTQKDDNITPSLGQFIALMRESGAYHDPIIDVWYPQSAFHRIGIPTAAVGHFNCPQTIAAGVIQAYARDMLDDTVPLPRRQAAKNVITQVYEWRPRTAKRVTTELDISRVKGLN